MLFDHQNVLLMDASSSDTGQHSVETVFIWLLSHLMTQEVSAILCVCVCFC